MKKFIIAFILFFATNAFSQLWYVDRQDLFFTNSNKDTLAAAAYDTTAAIQLIFDAAGADTVATFIWVQTAVDFTTNTDDADFFIIGSDDNTLYDTQQTPYDQWSVDEASSATRTTARRVSPGPKYMKVVAFNDDASVQIIFRAKIIIVYSIDNT